MQQAADVLDDVRPVRPPHLRRRPQKLHGYFLGFTAVFVVLVLAGFSRTYFIPIAHGTFARPPLVHLHGALFLAWTLLLPVQALLAATRRLRAHRRVGSLAGWLVIPMLITGTLVAARDTVNDFRAGDGNAALAFFYGELADLAMFGLLAGGAMLLRNRPDFHKRWVLLGSLGLLGAAVGRIPDLGSYYPYIFIALIASVAVYDLASRRAVHVATVIAAAILLTLNFTEAPIGNTPTWIGAAHDLLRV